MEAAGRKCGTQNHRTCRHAPRVWVPDSRCAASGMTQGDSSVGRQSPASLSHSTIFCLGMAPTFIEAIWPSLNSIMVGMPRTP